MKLQYLYDIYNNPYIGFNIDFNTKDINGNTLIDLLNIAKIKINNFDEFNKKLLDRNNNKYHITVFNVMEYIKNKNLNKFIGLAINNIEYLGIGSIINNDKETFFIVIKLDIINTLRKTVNLVPKDLHITIGFTHNDLFNKNKDILNIHKI